MTCEYDSEVHDMGMSRLSFLVLMVSAVVTAIPLLTGCKKAESTSDAPTQYTCAHHPEVVQSSPGKCPKCNMDLTPKKS